MYSRLFSALGLSLAIGLAAPVAAQNNFGEIRVQPGAGGFGGQGGGLGAQQPGVGFAGQQPGGGIAGQQPGGGFAGQQPGGGGMFGGQQPPNQQPGQQPGQNPQLTAYLEQLAQQERQDFGVPASPQLHTGQMHGPTPASIPGGRLLTTRDMVQLVQSGQPYLLFDVLGSGQTLPGAIPAVQAAQPGSFNDQISQQMGQFLQQATRGNKQAPLIFYCASVQCWMSYNASLRAINLGYTNVLWYRGGIQAWQAIGGPVVAAGGGFDSSGQQPQQPLPQQPGIQQQQPGLQQQQGFPQQQQGFQQQPGFQQQGGAFGQGG